MSEDDTHAFDIMAGRLLGDYTNTVNHEKEFQALIKRLGIEQVKK
jgi:hypothetical protein